MPKQAAPGPRTATPASAQGAPGKKRSRAVGPSSAPTASTQSVARREPSHSEIAERAYSRYAARGFRDGDPVWDWVSAEQELRSA